MNEIAEKLYEFCSESKTFEDLLKGVFDHYGLVMNAGQYILAGSTVRSYLSYLYDSGKIVFEFIDSDMLSPLS